VAIGTRRKIKHSWDTKENCKKQKGRSDYHRRG